jgi:GNAT superfamily N-acetyltransferase
VIRTVIAYGYDWWRGDPIPELPPLAGFSAAPSDDGLLLARLVGGDEGEVGRGAAGGSQPYVAWMGKHPVAYGWSAAGCYEAPPTGADIPLSPDERVFWDFVTLPEWRGQGIYPRLLQAILTLEEPAASRFSIGHAADNTASQRGIVKAGFQLLAKFVQTEDGGVGAVVIGRPDRALLSPFRTMLEAMPVENRGDR